LADYYDGLQFQTSHYQHRDGYYGDFQQAAGPAFSIATDSTTSSDEREGFSATMTISLRGSTETVTTSVGGDFVVAASALASRGATPSLVSINPVAKNFAIKIDY